MEERWLKSPLIDVYQIGTLMNLGDDQISQVIDL